jgi:radical SAM-linked protein
MKVRMAYTKKGSAKYIAHLDLTRLFQRAFRRAEVDILYSEGFNPHPKISFGAPLPVGMEGEREYVDVELVDLGFEDMQEAFRRLSSQMPQGIELLSCQVVPVGAPKLMALLDTAVYLVEVPLRGVDEAAEGSGGGLTHFAIAIQRWLQRSEILWERRKENKVLSVDIRPFIRSVTVSEVRPLPETRVFPEEHAGIIVVFEIAAVIGNAGSVRPLEIVGALGRDRDFRFDLDRAQARRTGVYWIDAGGELRVPDA